MIEKACATTTIVATVPGFGFQVSSYADSQFVFQNSITTTDPFTVLRECSFKCSDSLYDSNAIKRQ